MAFQRNDAAIIALPRQLLGQPQWQVALPARRTWPRTGALLLLDAPAELREEGSSGWKPCTGATCIRSTVIPVNRLSEILLIRFSFNRNTIIPNSRTSVISFASTRGDVEKTPLAFALPTGLVDRMTGTPEYRIACIDADPNRTLDTSLHKAETKLCEQRVSGMEAMHRRSVHDVLPLTR